MTIEDWFAEAIEALKEVRIADALECLAESEDCDPDLWAGKRFYHGRAPRPTARDRALAEAITVEAEDLIRVGLIADAIRRLECFCRPKFISEADCASRTPRR